jgi:hypothetical protein
MTVTLPVVSLDVLVRYDLRLLALQAIKKLSFPDRRAKIDILLATILELEQKTRIRHQPKSCVTRSQKAGTIEQLTRWWEYILSEKNDCCRLKAIQSTA